jgi:putative ABC transport system permease protein
MSFRPAHTLRTFVAKLRGMWRGQRPDTELDVEIDEHLRLLTERFVAQGMSREAAALAARRQFGNLTRLHEDRTALQSFPSMDAVWRDFLYALRTLAKHRGFTAISIATLGLGIGAATAIFSVVDNVLLAPFPYAGAERMVFPRVHDPQKGPDVGRQGFTAAEVLAFAEQNQVFDGFTAASDDLVLYRHREGTEQLYGAHVTPGTFEFFGMPALYGRVLQPNDYEPGAPPVFVMRYKTWMERFNGDQSLLNRTLVLNGTPRTLVGIMPPRFGWYEADVLIPEQLTRQAGAPARGRGMWFMVGRLKPGVSTQQAEADLTVIANRLAKLSPPDYPAHFKVQAIWLTDLALGPTLYTVLGAVCLLLLIACGNVATLMLARATTREKECALRVALGAGRGRLVPLLMIESLTLAIGGALLGILLAWGGLKVIVTALPSNIIPTESVIELNAPVLAFTMVTAMLTALLFGLAPALQLSRSDLNTALRDNAKSVGGGGVRGRRLRDAVVVLEVALSLILLIGAGLLMRGFVALRDVHLGFQPDHVFQAVLPLPLDRYQTPEQVTRFVTPLLARVQSLPGVVDVATSTANPPLNFAGTTIDIAGKAHQEKWSTQFQGVSENYFRTLRIELTTGRTFTNAEVDAARRVAVVNDAFVRKYLPGENPIGQRVRLARFDKPSQPMADPSFEIIGVVANVINSGLRVPIEPEVWTPFTLSAPGAKVLLVRTSQDPATMMNAVRKEVWATDSGVAIVNPGPLTDRVNARLYAGPRFGFLLMTIFGALGLMLVTVGVYSVLAYSTVQKTQEIGIRMALGAQAGDVLGQVVRTGLRLVFVGIVIGISGSLILGRAIEAQLTGVSAYDPATLAATTVLLMLTVTIACWIPARRAARVDPVIALRSE